MVQQESKQRRKSLWLDNYCRNTVNVEGNYEERMAMRFVQDFADKILDLYTSIEGVESIKPYVEELRFYFHRTEIHSYIVDDLIEDILDYEGEWKYNPIFDLPQVIGNVYNKHRLRRDGFDKD